MMYLSLCIFFLVYFVAVTAVEQAQSPNSHFRFYNPAVHSTDVSPTFEGWLKSAGIDVKKALEEIRAGKKPLSAKTSVKKMDGVFLDGSITVTYYNEDRCGGPATSKLVWPLNQCHPWFGSDGVYGSVQVEENALGNGVHRVYLELFYDDTCQGELLSFGGGRVSWGQCDREDNFRTNYDSTGNPAPSDVLLPVFVGTYDCPKNCFKNDGQTGLVEALYFRKNFCVRGGGYDLFISGCDSKGQLVGTEYDSTDGTCRNGYVDDLRLRRKLTEVYPFRFAKDEGCGEDLSALSYFGFLGHLNFICKK